jgi:hypothetical protein
MSIAILLSILTSRLGRYVAMLGVAGLVVSGAYFKGRSDYKAVCIAQAVAERAKQVNANLAATKFTNDRIESLHAMVDTLQSELQKVQDEADKDPAADSNGISADSVRRIDRIR